MKKPPEWYRGTISKTNGAVPPEGEVKPEGPDVHQAVDGHEPELSSWEKDIAEVRETLEELVKERRYTGYHLILHYEDPEKDDETWEAITMGMTLKDLVFAAVNMHARIQELIISTQDSNPQG